MDQTCFLCQEPAKMRCDNCDMAPWFCCDGHLGLHSQRNNEESKSSEQCFPYQIVQQEGVGRCLVASRDISAGEVMFEESLPLAVGPSANSDNQCLICRKKVSTPYLCSGCDYPMCSPNCASDHNKLQECGVIGIMGEMRLRLEEEEEVFLYEPILALRLLLLRLKDSELHRLSCSLMDHNDERRSDTEHWKRTQRDVALPLFQAMKESQIIKDITLDEVNRAVGVAEVNCYEISNKTGDCGVRCVYPVTSLLSHDCAPNCRLASAPATCSNRCIAAVDILKGEELTISYLPLNSDTRSRREKLKEDWYFDCACKRCRDPTEFGTNLGGVKCQKCEIGTLLNQDPINARSVWKCNACHAKVTCDIVTNLVDDLSREKSLLERNDVDEYLKFIDKASRLLHENHYLVNSARRWLIPLYCRTLNAGDPIQITDDMLERKISMCKSYLKVLDKIERGLTKNRGRILYELAETSVSLSNRKFTSGSIMRGEIFAEELRTCRSIAEEAVKCLRYDSSDTFEGYVHSAAETLILNIDNITKWLKKTMANR